MNVDPNLALAESCVRAIKTAWTAWKREEAPKEDSDEAYTRYVASLEVHLRAVPGRPAIIVVEITDRRPGRSHLSAYEHEMRGGQVLFGSREAST